MSVDGGTHLSDRYILLDQIGAGGMGSVWRAVDELLDREVAIKVVAAPLSDDADIVQRFRREAKAAARLDHPHIAHVYDYGEVGHAGQAVQYLVMELLTGRTLADRLRDGRLPVETAVTIGADVAEALAAAHRRGVVHRDITPGNIMLTPTGVKVLDFGISTIAGEAAMTLAGRALGTPAYVAPERLVPRTDPPPGQSGDAGPRSHPAVDVYSLGAVLIHTVTGRPPYEGSWSEQAHAHVHQAPPPLTGMPDDLAALLRACLAKDPAARPSSDELATLLRQMIGKPPVAPPTGRSTMVLPAQPGAPDATTVMPTYTEPVVQSRSTSRMAAWVALIAAIVAAVLVAANLLTRPSPTASSNASEPDASQEASEPPVEQPTTSTAESPVADALNDIRDIAEDALQTNEMSLRAALELGRLLDRTVNQLQRGDLRDAERTLEDAADRLEQRLQDGEVSEEVYSQLDELLGRIADRVNAASNG